MEYIAERAKQITTPDPTKSGNKIDPVYAELRERRKPHTLFGT